MAAPPAPSVPTTVKPEMNILRSMGMLRVVGLFFAQLSFRFPPPGLHPQLVDDRRRGIGEVSNKLLAMRRYLFIPEQSHGQDTVPDGVEQRNKMPARIFTRQS